MPRVRLLLLFFTTALSLLAPPVQARSKFVLPKQIPSELRDQFLVFTTGRGRYLIVPNFQRGMDIKRRNELRHYVFYGDAKHVYHQHLFGGANIRPDGTFRLYIRDYRMNKSQLMDVHGKAPYMKCNEEKLPLQQLSAAKARAFIDKAELRPRPWRREPHLLARDDEGRYFYVDRVHARRLRRRAIPLNELRGFRLFVGRRGHAKAVPLRDAVLDAAGQIFLTKKGALHVDNKGGKIFWRVGKRRTYLTSVPLDQRDTWILIHRYLGAYAGVRFQVPCEGL